MKKSTLLAVLLLSSTLALGWWWLERSTRPAESAGGPGELRPVVTLPVSESPPPLVADATSPATDSTATETAAEPANDMPAEAAQSDRPAGVPTVGDILEDPSDDYVAVARRLAELVRDTRLPMEERAEALAHTLNLSAGNEAAVLTPLIKDSAVADELAGTILDEALNRPLSFQADLYLEALKERQTEEMQTKIREHLTFLTGGEDLGANPANWTQAIAAAKQQWNETP